MEVNYKSAFNRFVIAWLASALTWPTILMNFSEPNWSKPLIYIAAFLFIPGVIAIALPTHKKRYYIPVSWVVGFGITFIIISNFFMDIFSP